MVEFNGRNLPNLLEQVLPQVLPLIGKFNTQNLRSIPPFILFRAFLGLFLSFYMSELLLANAPTALMSEDALDHFVEIFLHGVLIPKEPA
jgi:hypothetical protein